MPNEVKGLRDVTQRMRALPVKLREKALVSALRTAGRVPLRAAKARAKQFDDPHTASKVWKEVIMRVNKRIVPQDVGRAVQVGVRGGAKRYKNTRENRSRKRVGGSYEGPGNVYYWRFLEFGTSKMRAQPFMRPAINNNVQKTIDAFTEALDKKLTELTRK